MLTQSLTLLSEEKFGSWLEEALCRKGRRKPTSRLPTLYDCLITLYQLGHPCCVGEALPHHTSARSGESSEDLDGDRFKKVQNKAASTLPNPHELEWINVDIIGMDITNMSHSGNFNLPNLDDGWWGGCCVRPTST